MRWEGGNAVGSMGRTSFARGPYDTRGRSAKQGPKSMALPRGNATGVVPPRKGSPPHRAVGTGGSEERGVERVGWGGPDGGWVGSFGFRVAGGWHCGVGRT
ncbi:hypothetical protein GCM10010483_10650 [Actinokineospora diospyrosa]